MAITAVNATWQGAPPVAGGSTTLALGGTSCQELAYIGTGTSVLDGSLTSFVVNFLDGTNTLSFIPSAVMVTRTGGNVAATVAVSGASTINNAAFTCSTTGAGSNGNTISYVFFVLK